MSHWNEGIRGQTCEVLVAVVSLNDSRCTDVRLSACLGTSGSLKIHFGVFVIRGGKKTTTKNQEPKNRLVPAVIRQPFSFIYVEKVATRMFVNQTEFEQQFT